MAAQNGRLPDSALRPIAGGRLSKRAAAGFNSLNLYLYHYKDTGPVVPGGSDSSYRTYAGQVYWRNHWCALGKCGNAAVPGTSNHGWGNAVDVPNATHQQLLRTYGTQFGWHWGEAPTEPWHFTYRGGFSRPDPGPDVKNPIIRKGSGGISQEWACRQVKRHLRRHGLWGENRSVDGGIGRRAHHAIQDFQRQHGLKPDGVVGAKTWAKLRAPEKERPKPEPKPQPEPKPEPKPTKPKPDPKPRPRGARGVDVSSYQGNIDWPKVRRAGYEYAVIKASDGDIEDPTFTNERMKALDDAGIKWSAYHYARVAGPGNNHRTGSKEAQMVYRHLSQTKWDAAKNGLWYDIEETNGASQDATATHVLQFVREWKRLTGHLPGIYTMPGFWNLLLDDFELDEEQELKRCPLWIAHWGVSSPAIPLPWKRHRVWQYTDSGRVDGINGLVDLNHVRNIHDIL